MSGNARRRSVAPAELARLLAHPEPLSRTGWTPEQIKEEKDRLNHLQEELYGRVAFRPEPGTENPIPAGGHMRGICCSHKWADEAWHRGQQYPPAPTIRIIPRSPGKEARPHRTGAMKCCRRCSAYVPGIYLTDGKHCEDCRFETMPQYLADQLSGMSASVVGATHLRGLE